MRYLRPELVLLFLLGFSLRAQADYHPPKLYSYISSTVEIGVEREGKIDTVITHDRSFTRTTNTVDSVSRAKSFVESVSNTKKKETNPDKRKSRPKASGLFGGIARAFAGDYSGLLDWGGQFADHMMEPRYLWHVTQVYSTDKKHTLTRLNSRDETAASSDAFIQKVTQTYSKDINKGFIKFAVTVRNEGNRSVRIAKPIFVVNFVKPDDSRYLVDQVIGETPEKNQVSIPPGGQHVFTVHVKNRDISTLANQYYSSEGVEAEMQNAETSHGGQMLTINEVIEKELQDSIRMEFYNGSTRTIKFVKLGGKRPTLKEFLDDEIGNSFIKYNEALGEGDLVDDYFVSIKGLANRHANQRLDQLGGQPLLEWRRWFVAVSDDNGDFLPFKVGDKLRPGYSLLLGYYGGKELLGENFHPVIYSRTGVLVTEKAPLHIDVDLKPGDQIELSNVKLKKLHGSKVTYRVTNKRQLSGSEIVMPWNTIPDEYERSEGMRALGNVSMQDNSYMAPSRYAITLVPERVEPTPITSTHFAFLRRESEARGRWMTKQDIEAQLQDMLFPALLVNSFVNLRLTGDMGKQQQQVFEASLQPSPATRGSIQLDSSVGLEFLKEFLGTRDFEEKVRAVTERVIEVDQPVRRQDNVWKIPIIPLEFPSMSLVSPRDIPFNNNQELSVISLGIGSLAAYTEFQVGRQSLYSPFMPSPMMGMYMGLGYMSGYSPCQTINLLGVSRLRGFEAAVPTSNISTCAPGGPSLKQEHPLYELSIDVKVIRRS